MARKRQLRTCTIMVQTDGTTSNYVVMQGPMRGRLFNAAAADIMATYKLVNSRPDYRAMTARHATPNAPAVPWQAPLSQKPGHYAAQWPIEHTGEPRSNP